MKGFCFRCRAAVTLPGRVGRRDACPSCGWDLHICLNCTFYEPGAYNDCREPQAERVTVKDRANFCDFFTLRETPPEKAPDKGDVKDRLRALFKD
ncbi:MAG TPA: hypothetical protein P5269_02660 [Syntrophales bacterium]|nr:hypothetical protein [Syntrophales bacterium]HRS86513.1 hypothetical protein [Syntrophales bacterium]